MDFSPSGSLQLHLSAAVQLLHYKIGCHANFYHAESLRQRLYRELSRTSQVETSSVWLFATPKETIKEIKMRFGGGRKIEIFGSGGPT